MAPAAMFVGEVARVDVRDRGDEGRAEERRQAAQPAPLARERTLGRAQDGGLSGERVLDARDEARGGGVASAQACSQLGSGFHTGHPTEI